MFEHFKMSKKLKQQLGKVVSIALSVAMLAGSIPADMLGGIADVKAAEGGQVDASELGDGASFPSGTFTGNGVANVAKDSENSDKLYFGLSSSSTIEFSVPTDNTGSLTVTSSDNSALSLSKDNDSVSGWSELAAGNYTLSSSGEVKLYSISLSLTEITPPDGDTVTVQVTVSIGDGVTLGDNDTITLTPGSGEPVMISKDGGSITLKKGIAYTLGCSNNEVNAVAIVDGSSEEVTSVTVSEDTSLTINLSSKAGGTEVTATVTISDENSLLDGNAQLKLVSAESESSEVPQDLTNEGSVILIAGNKYKIDSASIPTGIKAVLSGADADGVITATEGMTTLTVTITESGSEDTVSATITLNTDNAVLDNITNYTIKLVNASDSTDVVEYNANSTDAYTLKQNATYNVESSVDEIKATVDGKKTVETKAVNLTLRIDLATQVEANVEFTGDELPTGAVVKLTNKNDEEDIVILTGLAETAKVKLWIGDEYELSSTPSTVDAKIDNKTSLTVTKTTTSISVAIKVTEGGDAGTITNTYVLDATTIPNGTDDSGVAKDNMPYNDGAKLGDNNYYSVWLGKANEGSSSEINGYVYKRNGSTTLKALEINKYGSAAIKFTVKGTADAEFKVSSTGSSNFSAIALIDENGNIVSPSSTDIKDNSAVTPNPNTDGVYLVYGNQANASTLYYSGLAAGTYSIVSPIVADSSFTVNGTTGYDRAVWLIKATVDDTVEVVTKTEEYVLDATTIPNGTDDSGAAKDNMPYNDGAKLGDNNYYSVWLGKANEGSSSEVNGYVYKRNGSTTLKALEINKYGSAAIKFTVKGTADAEFKVSSTGSSNFSAIALIDENGNIVSPSSTDIKDNSAVTPNPNTDGVYLVYGNQANASTLCYSGLAAGTYSIVSPIVADSSFTVNGTTGYDRAVWLIKATVTDTFADTGESRLDWSDVPEPEIKSAEQEVDTDGNKLGTISVTATGVVGNDGADKIEVAMYKVETLEGEDEEATETETIVSTQAREADTNEGEEFSFTFTPASSGKYRFKITAIRSGEADKPGDSKDVDFSLPLEAPKNLYVRNLGEGKIIATWDEVLEAEQYVIKALKADDTEAFSHDNVTAAEYTSTDEDALELGETYTISVAAKRGEETGAFCTAVAITVKSEADAEKAYWDIDLTNGLKKDVGYADGSLTVMIDMPYTAKTTTIEGTEYLGYVKGGTNPKTGGSASVGTVPDNESSVIKLTATKDGRLTIVCQTTGKDIYFVDVDEDDNVSYIKYALAEAAAMYKFDVQENHTYYYYASGSNMEVNAITVDYREATDVEWTEIPAPEITDISYETGSSTITIKAKGLVGVTDEEPVLSYAKTLRVDMIDSKGDVVKSLSTSKTNTDPDNLEEQTFEFEPNASDKYTFIAYLERPGENDKAGKESNEIDFKLPIAAPVIASVTNKGGTENKYKLEVVWSKVPEARTYTVYIYDEYTITSGVFEPTHTAVTAGPTTALTSTLEVPVTIGSKVAVSVIAIDKNGNKSSESADTIKEMTVTGETDTTWAYTVYGSNISTATNGYADGFGKSSTSTGDWDESSKLIIADKAGARPEGIALDKPGGQVQIWSEDGRGKIVPASTDGLSYYYTTIGADDNFVLEASIHVNGWQYSNGQDGFGMMASDTIGVSGDDTALWNNSYQLLSSKIQYRYNLDTHKEVTGSNADYLRYDMQLGLGWTTKLGTTITDVTKINKGELTTPENFVSTSGTLETSMLEAEYDGEDKDDPDSPNVEREIIVDEETGEETTVYHYARGVYNIVGNADTVTTKTNPPTTIVNDGNGITEFRLRMIRNNSGYILQYLSPEPNENGEYEILRSQAFADDARNSLSQIDKKNIYIGFFAARRARITVSNVTLLVGPDAGKEYEQEIETEELARSLQISSASTSNSQNYDLVFKGNAAGTLSIINTTTGKVVASDVYVNANTAYTSTTKLQLGTNSFEVVFDPDMDYEPSQGQKMDDYTKWTRSFNVTYQVLNDEIWVAPNGTADGEGTKESPLDINSAVAYAAPGQTIYLMEGRYDLPGTSNSESPLAIKKGHDGTASKPITMMPDPDATSRPILDFNGQTANYPAFTIAGNYWILEGFDVTNSIDGQDGILLGGSYNVLNDIHAYDNGNTGIQIARSSDETRADWPAYNTVINCTSFHNVDSGKEDADGFAAKLTVGDGNKFIGCIAAYNADDGWDLFAKVETGSIGVVTIDNCIAFRNGYNYDVDEDGNLYEYVDTGNGNGFKMGGDSMSGYHVLKNSIAFGNKTKGIDSNSCPDNQIYNSTSYMNGDANVALYTSTAVNTDYYAENILSISGGASDNIQLKGTQNLSKIYNSSNYLYSGVTYNAADSSKSKVDVSNIFESTDIMKAVQDWWKGTMPGPESEGITRDVNGNIIMNGFLVLSEEGREKLNGVGAILEDTSSSAADAINTITVNVYAGTVSKLSDVKLTGIAALEGYSWKYPNTDLTVFAGTQSEFIASAEGKKDKAVVVNFIDITDVKFEVYDSYGNSVNTDNDNYVQIGEAKLTIKAVPVIMPEIDLEKADIQGSVTFAYDIKESTKLGLTIADAVLDAVEEGQTSNTTTVGNTILTVTNKNVKSITRSTSAKDGAAKITVAMTATIKGTKTKTVKKQVTYGFISRAETSKFSYTLDSLKGMVEEDFKYEELPDADEDGQPEKGNIISATADVGDSFTLKDLKVALGNGNSNTAVKVSVSDTKVLTLTSSTNTFTAKGEGTATITLTAAGDKTVKETIDVTVRGALLKTNASTIIVDQAKYTGTQIKISACYGETLDTTKDITVKSVNKGSASNFTVKHISGGIYSLIVGNGTRTDTTTMANGTYTVTLQGYLKDSENPVEVEALLVKVTKTKPTVTIKQKTKVNLFYKYNAANAAGTITATSKQAAVTLEVDTSQTSDFTLTPSGAGYSVTLNSAGQDKLDKVYPSVSKAKLANKMNVTAKFNGYKSMYDISRTISISASRQVPKIALEVDNNVFYTKLGIKDTKVRVLDKASKTYLSGIAVTLATSKPAYTKANEKAGFWIEEEAGDFVLTAEKSGTAQISVFDADWNEEIVLKQRITINTKLPKATFKAASLNIGTDYIGKEQSSTLIKVTNATDYTIRNLTLTGKNAKAEALLPYLNYSSNITADEEGNHYFDVSLSKDTPTNLLKSGSYSFNAKFALNKLYDQTAVISIKLVKNVPTITVKQSGKIDLVNRTGSSVTIKPVMKYLTGTISGMYFEDDASNQFNVTWDNSKGAAVVTAKEFADMKQNGKYKVTPVFIVWTNNGRVDVKAKSIFITTKQSSVKTTTIPLLEARLSNPSALTQATLAATSPATAEITSVTQLNNLNNFTVDYDAGGDIVSVHIKSTTGLKYGATYKITVALNIEGSGVNAKQQTVSIPVKILR